MTGLFKSLLSISIVIFLFVTITPAAFAEGNNAAAYNQDGSLVAGTISTISTSMIHTISADAANLSRVGLINANTISVIGASKINVINTSAIRVISLNLIGSSPVAAADQVNASFPGTDAAGSSPGIVPNADELIQFAKSLLGTPYVYAGMSPAGFDCSGFTSYVFGAFGIRLERVSSDQAKQGIEILKENLKPGDLVFFDTNGGHSVINHTGIFIGDGKFIHASSGTSRYVIISDLTTGYYSENYITARRIYS